MKIINVSTFKSITLIEIFILMSPILFVFMPLGISRMEVLGPGYFDFFITIYHCTIMELDLGPSTEEMLKYCESHGPVTPNIVLSSVIALIVGIISFVCMIIRHPLSSIWFFIIFVLIMVFWYLIFFSGYNRTGQIMFITEKLILLFYGFCNLYVGYKKVLGRSGSRKIGVTPQLVTLNI